MKSKLIQIPYTLAIIKPHLALQPNKVAEVYKDIDENHFKVFYEERRTLTKQEVLNLFYVHRYANYYEEIEQAMMTADSIVMLITNRVEFLKSDDPAAPEDVKLATPSERWKELIGDKDPAVAKENGQLRGKYGKDVI